MENFSDRLSALRNEALNHIESFMEDLESFRFVTDQQEDDDEFDDTVAIAFYNKHGIEDNAYVTRIFKNAKDPNHLYVEGVAYEAGQRIQMLVIDADYGDVCYLADICCEQVGIL